MSEKWENRRWRDTSAKLIFGDATLCAQFLRGYVGIPILEEVQPEDIEDVTERYLHMFTEERDSDIVKRVHIRGIGERNFKNGQYPEEFPPFFIISLIEHKSKVDYNVVMQIFRYMSFIWEDYEREMEKKQKGISRRKGFRYLPILPIVFYDGGDSWTAATSLRERIWSCGIPEEYIPDYRCLLVQLKDYSNEQLMERKDELSVVMMLDKLQDVAEFARLGTGEEAGYLGEVLAGSPEYLLEIISRMAEVLLGRLNVPFEETEAFTNQIKERRMGELFSNFKGYDVQATRREAYREGERKGEVKKLIGLIRKKAAKNQAAEVTAEMLEEDVGLVRRVYDLIARHPEWEEESIWKELEREEQSEEMA